MPAVGKESWLWSGRQQGKLEPVRTNQLLSTVSKLIDLDDLQEKLVPLPQSWVYTQPRTQTAEGGDAAGVGELRAWMLSCTLKWASRPECPEVCPAIMPRILLCPSQWTGCYFTSAFQILHKILLRSALTWNYPGRDPWETQFQLSYKAITSMHT